MVKKKYILAALVFLPMAAAASDSSELTVTINRVDASGVHDSLGTVTVKESSNGLILSPSLKGLPPGPHGFHIHENGDCGPKEKDGKMTAAQAAGAHYDPDKSAKHEGPTGHGHRGDLPYIEVAQDGTATKQVTVSRLRLQDVRGRSLMVHAGGDNYSDSPEPLGGGGARIACGVIE